MEDLAVTEKGGRKCPEVTEQVRTEQMAALEKRLSETKDE
jgi:hypothetical protein